MRSRLTWLAALLVVLATSGAATAERLGGSYRGPGDVAGERDGPRSSGGAGKTSGGTTSGEGSSGGRGSGGSSGDSGGSSGGGTGPASGGSSGGSGGGNKPNRQHRGPIGDVPPPGSEPADPSSPGGSGGPDAGGDGSGDGGDDSGRGAGGGSSDSDPGAGSGGDREPASLDSVASYFERNRERFLGDAVRRRDARLRKLQAGQTFDGPADGRVRSDLTAADRERIRAHLVANAASPDELVRDAAAVALGKEGSPESVKALLARLLDEKSIDVRQDVVLALGISRSPGAVDALVEIARTGDRRLQPFALLALGVTRDPVHAGPAVLEAFKANAKSGEESEELAAAAAVSLGTLGHTDAAPALLQAVAAKGTREVVKVHAVRALGSLATDEARRALESLVDSNESVDVRRAALLALGRFPTRDVARVLRGNDALRSSDGLSSAFAAVSLVDVAASLPDADRARAVAEAREAAEGARRAALRSEYASLALGVLDADAGAPRQRPEWKALVAMSRDVLSSLALSWGVEGRTEAAAALSQIATAKSADPHLRGCAAMSLAMLTLDLGRTAKTLREVAASAEHADVQRGAILGLGLVGDRKDVEFLAGVLARRDLRRQPTSDVRGAAATALGLIRDGGSIARVEALLAHEEPSVRAFALAALGAIIDKDPTPALPALFERANFRKEFAALRVAMRTL